MENLTEAAYGFHVRLTNTPAPLEALAYRLPADAVPGLVTQFEVGLAPITTGPLMAHRLMLPLWDGEKVVGFRCLTWSDNDKRPKAIPYPTNTPDHQPFGLAPTTAAEFSRTRFAVVVEGEVDALTLWALGIPAVACSTSYLAKYQAAMLADLVDTAVVWADYDEAGRKGCRQTMDTLGALGVSTAAMERARPYDANDLLRQAGADVVRQVVSDTCVDAALCPGGVLPWS